MAAQYPEPSRQSLDLTTNGRANPAKSNNPPSDAGSKKGLVPTHAPHQHHLLTQRSIVLEESSTSTSISSEAPDDESFAFGIEKGFWRVEHGARELLRFAELFRKHRKAMTDEERSSIALLPKGIDVISMTQLSYSILHAVSDINVHSQKALHDRGPLSSSHVNRVSKSRAKRSRKRKTPSSLQQTTQTTEITCEECFCTNTPQWRNDAAGRTLCNFCGLIYAKRCQMYGSE